MLKLIETVEGVGVLASIVLFWVAIMAIKEVIEMYKYFKGKLEEWRNTKNGIEKKEDDINTRIKKLEEENKWTREELCKQSEMMEEIVSMLKEQKKDSDRVTVANTRATLHVITAPALNRGTWTQVEYDIFSDLADIYEEKHGNHSMQQKVIPMARKLPIQIEL